MRSLLASALLTLAPLANADDVFGIAISLPPNVEWKQLSDKVEGLQYLREWIPATTDAARIDWIIVEQKLAIAPRTTPKKYLSLLKAAAKQACPGVVFDGPHKVASDSAQSFWMQSVCNRYTDDDFGTFMDQRFVFAEGFVYVVTSELRAASSPVAGTLQFGTEEAEAKEFVARMTASTKFARESIRICGPPGCKD